MGKINWIKFTNNNITEIEPLYSIQLLFLEKLDLSNNSISDFW